MNRQNLRLIAFLAALALLTLAVAACGGGGSSSGSTAESTSAETSEETGATEEEGGAGEGIAIDVGTKTIEFPAGTKPKIAFFAGAGNSFQEASRKGAEIEAKEIGAELTWFDGKYSPEVQLPLLQNALATGDFNAWVIENFSGEASCPIVKQAIDKGIVVVQKANFVCGYQQKPANEEAWMEGTLASVGACCQSTFYNGFAKEVAAKISPDAVVGFINGPPGPAATEFEAAMLPSAGIHVTDEVSTELYTTPEGLTETQNMLQANPDMNVIVAGPTDVTIGVARAIEQAGKDGEVEVFDLGAAKASVKLIEEGKITMAAPFFPQTEGEAAVGAIGQAFAGESVERFNPGFEQGSPAKPFVVTKENLAEYTPQY